MAMDSTMQIRMDSDLKAEVEALYRGMGTSFAEAVRMFARQSLLVGGMPFRPTLKTWDELTSDELDARLTQSGQDIAMGCVKTQAQLDKMMRERFGNGRTASV